eukprot:7259392-Alexandrium_andersonii.AAC.1
MASCMKEAAKGVITTTAPKPKHPWISEETAAMLAKRGELAAKGRYAEAADQDKCIKKAARKDR